MLRDSYLLIDFGSTYTKLTLVDLVNETIVATSKDITTIDTNIMDGFNNAFEKLKPIIAQNELNIIKKVACSSAAGGLKMIAIGLVPELTAEAAKRAALGAGARVIKTYSYELNNDECLEIVNSDCDIILLAGGTDGGNKTTVVENATKLASHNVQVPIIVACNKNAQDEIKTIFKDNQNIFYTENVMPRLNVLNVEPTREVIRHVFMENIIYAKGIDNALDFINNIMMPTPAAVLKLADVLSEGTDEEEGLGDILIVDIGGATTDIHSACDGYPTSSASLKGLEEPYLKRTVEGDLGMRYSAVSLFEAAGSRMMRKFLNDDKKAIDLKKHINYRHEHIRFVATDASDIAFDEAMAKIATSLSMNRHAGYLEVMYTPLGSQVNQIGKDLLNTKYVIGTGGVIVHSKNSKAILEAGCFDEADPLILRPRNPEFLLDESYIISALGLLSFDYPDLANRLAKKYLIKL